MVQNCRKLHGLWGRASREWEAAVEQSQSCENTKGCKFEQDLGTAIVDGKAFGKQLVEWERKFRIENSFNDDDVTAIAETGQKILALMKLGGTKVIALKFWFKID